MGPGIGKAIAGAALEAEAGIYRTNLTYLLGEIKNRDVGPALAKLLADPEPDVRSAAAFSLGKIGDLEIETLRVTAQTDADTRVRVRAIVALGKGRQKQVVDWLIEFLGHADPEVRQAANYTLNQATRQDLGFNAYYPESRRNRAVDKWKKWWGENKDGFEFPSRPEGGGRRGRHFETEVWVDEVPPQVGVAVPMPPPAPAAAAGRGLRVVEEEAPAAPVVPVDPAQEVPEDR